MHTRLNDSQAIRANDPGDMFGAIYNLPDQCEEAFNIAANVNLAPNLATGLTNIVVAGMGGSAIGGDLLRVLIGPRAAIPVLVTRDYTLPNFVGPNTLVFATSFSGNTEETLSCYKQARAQEARIIVITSGGKLKEIADRDGIPVISVPGGISPRAATGYLFLPTVVILQRLGLIPDATSEIREAITQLRTIRETLNPQVPLETNLAKKIALRLADKIPVIYGSVGTTEVVAARWKGQINENAKSPAYWNVFPEMNHNEIVGFEQPAALLKNLELIILRDREDHPRVQKRMDISKTIMGPAVSGITEVWSTGESALARTLSLTYTGDFVSAYLATLYNVDPTPVKMIDLLKEKLAEK
ncbi:MAG TPA: bifunctional phosphoglucose/phosphomannose isomerase [Bacillota bacterium]|nr:bifunctional phosphoglucose/phosphomannose isomerase [Bacillota bacterium]